MSASAARATSAITQHLEALDDLALELERELVDYWLRHTGDDAARMRAHLAAVRWARAELSLRLFGSSQQ